MKKVATMLSEHLSLEALRRGDASQVAELLQADVELSREWRRAVARYLMDPPKGRPPTPVIERWNRMAKQALTYDGHRADGCNHDEALEKTAEETASSIRQVERALRDRDEDIGEFIPPPI